MMPWPSPQKGYPPPCFNIKRARAAVSVWSSVKRARLPIIKFDNWESGPFSLAVSPFWTSYGQPRLFVFWPVACLGSGGNEFTPMKKPLIPWHVFREAIAGQDPMLLESWLDRWGFTDDGVVLIGAGKYSPVSALQLRGSDRRSDVALSALRTSILRILIDTGRLLSEETVAPWSYNKEL